MIDVIWYSENPDAISRGYWDQGWLEELLAGRLWAPPYPVEFRHLSNVSQVQESGAVLVVPARWFAGREAEIQSVIDQLGWCILILTGDEENVFNRHLLTGNSDAFRMWVQTPKVGTEREGERYIGDMCPPTTASELTDFSWDKDQDWFFAGQINTEQRRNLVKALNKRDGGKLLATSVFGSGMDYHEYLEGLARSKVAPAPAGSQTPDTFRFFEALEAGCIPVIQNDSYWNFFAGLPVVRFDGDWGPAIDYALEGWPNNATMASCWYQRYKRELARRFYQDLAELTEEPMPYQVNTAEAAARNITVIMPTSSTPSNPSTEIIEETMASVLEQLPGVQIIVMMDGLHTRHRRRSEEYAEYRRRVAWLCEHKWPNALPIFFKEHMHQAAMTKFVLDDVHTPQILFVEHDAPLMGEIPWPDLVTAVRTGDAEVVRFHHETMIQPEHERLMVDMKPQLLHGVPMMRTTQWSQRPHLANAGFYRGLLEKNFSNESRTFIEDVIYGIVENAWREYGLAGWDRFRLWMYAPKENLKRSTHLDARAGERRVPMTP